MTDFTHPSTDPSAHIGRREQVGAAAIFALAALLLAPLLWYGLPCSHDGLIHFYRIVHMADNARQGAPFLQWGEHFMRGYGYPILAFYAPLTYWATTALSFLGLGFSPAYRLFIWLVFFLAGLGGYNLGRRYFQPNAAFITGLAYLFAPYLILDAIQRGAVPETLGLALLPWALTAADIALARRSPRAIAVAAVLFAVMVLSHNIIPNFGFLILLVLSFSEARSWKNLRSVWQAVWPALLIIGLALGLSAFFWLPAFVELGNTMTRHPAPGISHWWPRYDGDFLQANKLVSWPDEPMDKALTNPPISRRLGLGQFGLALTGVLLLFASKQPRRRVLFAWVFILLGSLFLTNAVSRPLWMYLPLPDFVQLPSRFLGPASLALAVLAGIPLDWLSRRLQAGSGRQRWLLAGAVGGAAVVVVVSGWPWLYPTYCEPPADISMAMLADETLWSDEGLLYRCAGECLGEALPAWVEKMPPLDGVYAQYQNGTEVNRLQLPETAVLLDWQHAPARDEYRLHLPEAQVVTYNAFYFPGWRVWINGESAPLAPRAEDGLITFALPAGESVVTLKFGATPLRLATLLFSGVVALALIGWAWRRSDSFRGVKPPPSRRTFWLWLGILLILGAGKVLVDHVNSPIRADRLQNGRLLGVEHATQFNFSNEFMHFGYTGPERVAADKQFEVTQYWGALREIGVPYEFVLQIADEQGKVWNLPYSRPVEYQYLPGKPGWLVDHYARDTYQFELLPGTPPGEYWLEATIYRRDVDLSLIPAGAPVGSNPAIARLGRLQVTPGNWKPTAANAQVDTFAPTPVTELAEVLVTELAEVPDLTLLGWSVPDVVWRPGEQASLDLLWQGDSAIWDEQVTAELGLVNEDGEQVAETAVLIGSAGAETVVRNKVAWRLPPELESGTYALRLTIGEQMIALGEWQIDAPRRTFEQPEVDITSDFAVDFGRLVGYSTNSSVTEPVEVAPGDSFDLNLFWQATAETAVNYRVFVHLLDENGNLVTQSDAVPDHWTRPTTGWVPGEYITDRHTLTLPSDVAPGIYTLVVGFYETANGNRPGQAEIGTLKVLAGDAAVSP
ncbi:MAG: glycosyltransferase family 39 protein [Anaerolineae bacterium]|nr:glycosyltransferase family 39 protein [Anaerolineae bacterium]